MLGNNHVTCLSLTGVIVVTLGTVLGIIGLATSEWIVFESEELRIEHAVWKDTLAASGIEAVDNVSSVSCHLGLWQLCCADYGDIINCQPASRPVTTDMNAVRVLMLVMLLVLIASVVLLIVFIFKESCHSQLGSKLFISLLVSCGCIGFLMLVMAYVLLEYSNEMGFFSMGGAAKVTISWSFFLALIGGLINPLGLFLICTQWHYTEDKEAGVKYDYNKPRAGSVQAVDTYI